jgi:membrane protein DedA with SNARE-associated domain
VVTFNSVPETLQFLIRHGYLILFAVVFVEQAGLPVASVPLLLGVGALSADGRFSFGAALLVTLAACLPADAIWYELGRRKGYKVLRVLCFISLEPETCVERTTGSFTRHGMGTLVVSKFVPGLSAVATPMAGLLKMRPSQFLLLDALGAALWGGFYLTLGVIFRRELERIAFIVAKTGASLATVLICSIGGYLTWKWIGRRRYLRQLETARISPEELRRRMEGGEVFTILDLRHASEMEDGGTLPGALRFPPEELESRHHEVPRDRDIVLYCT